MFAVLEIQCKVIRELGKNQTRTRLLVAWNSTQNLDVRFERSLKFLKASHCCCVVLFKQVKLVTLFSNLLHESRWNGEVKGVDDFVSTGSQLLA